MALNAARLKVEVPSPKRNGASSTYTRPVIQRLPASQIRASTESSALKRLRSLTFQRELRTGSARPGGEHSAINELIFDQDRIEAATAIRNLIGRVRRSVTIVDPFFDAVGLREFALAAPEMGTQIKILTNYRGEGRDLDGTLVPMDALAAEFVTIERSLAERGLASLDVRVSGGEARRYHDRFLILDDDVWHCGHSFNQVGRAEVSAMTRLRRPERIQAMIEEDLDRAEVFADAHARWLAAQPPPLPKWRRAAAKFATKISKILESKS